MALYKGYKIEKLREIAREIGREGVAKEALKAVEDFDGSYKGVMELAGKLALIADMSTFDDYWQEQVERGLHKMTGRCLEIKVNLNHMAE